MRRAGVQIISALVLVTLSACAGQIRNHGYMPAPDQVADVLVGVDTRVARGRAGRGEVDQVH